MGLEGTFRTIRIDFSKDGIEREELKGQGNKVINMETLLVEWDRQEEICS